MESQLPRPKVKVSRSMNVLGTSKVKPLGINTSHNIMRPTSVETVQKVSETFKSISKINEKISKENKPPPNLLVDKSHVSCITTKPRQSQFTLKPSCSTSIEPEAKKRIVEPLVTDNANKMIEPKPKCWDLRGRLDCCEKQLRDLKQKHKKCSQFESTISNLCLEETQKRAQTEKLEKETAELSKAIAAYTKKNEVALRCCKDLDTEIGNSLLLSSQLGGALKERQQESESQSELIVKQLEKRKNLENNLEDYRLMNEGLIRKCRELQLLAHQLDKEKRILHNRLQEAKGNIRVFCRVRPRIPKESSKAICSMNFINESTIEIEHAESTEPSNYSGKPRSAKHEFSFDKIFPPDTKQSEIFEELSPLVQSALEGYNVCIFTYGQTGSGKTYTMEGGEDSETAGMIPRTVRHIYRQIEQSKHTGWEYKVEASFLEIYNEHIIDLLDPQVKNHEIRMVDVRGSDLYVTNLLIADINGPEELLSCLRTAQMNRAVAATQSNERSSRSHFISRIRLMGVNAERKELSIGNLNLIDLAGSERLKNEEIARTTETININKSLANLGNVIHALQKKQDHVPYRNSKLTHLLMPSLGGNSKTLMLLNVSPLDQDYTETISSLRFGNTVNNCTIENVKRSRIPNVNVF